MVYVAVFDIGTTAVKGVLIDEQAVPIGECSILLETIYGPNGEVEQNPLDWWNAVKEIASLWWNEHLIDPQSITMITFSGQMEDVIPISQENAEYNAILYSDTRAEKEATYINKEFPNINEQTGNSITASTPVAKLLWLKNNKSDIYNDADHFVFSAKDYIIYKLAHVFVTDPTTGATTGMMNLETCRWDRVITRKVGINDLKLPVLFRAEEMVGFVTDEAANETGFCESTPILCGCGDAAATTMGASATSKDDSYIYLGTTGWVAVIQDHIQLDYQSGGIFNLAHLPKNLNISIAPLLNVGNVHQWAIETFLKETGDDKYTAFEKLIAETEVGSNGLLFLPYLNGERNPIHDSEANGAFIRIGSNTNKGDFLRAVIEGISYSLKQLFELVTTYNNGTITLIGGGAKSDTWCQILADCINQPIRVPVQSEYMPSIGAAATAFVKLGWAEDYQDFSNRFLKTRESTTYNPIKENVEIYHEKYERYLKMYPNLKNI